MSMSAPTKEGEPMMEINTTPLIDVMLVLLVMLIITIPPQSHAVKMDMPQANQPPPEDLLEPEVVDLEIDFDGAVFWNGQPIRDTATLREYFSSAARRQPQPEIHIEPNRLAKYGVVAIVLAQAQKAGVTRIGFSGNEQYYED